MRRRRVQQAAGSGGGTNKIVELSAANLAAQSWSVALTSTMTLRAPISNPGAVFNSMDTHGGGRHGAVN